ncbi:TPA: alpha/beta hydrolase [Staphylococcus aureus]|uniref:alpha/beta hydrolase n=1 Tax=Staphylococcus aureus TaxID=1280 RepID=UPI001C1ECD4D|nr:alpha/beta hydrolase [Staphylococcus aureus]MBU6885083.1 alpha/beta hydrolase [Staphylococcus aureus]MBU6898326.1 alpha/beta hydrolase [Staphylococcus aureus]HCX2121476.1 alpha/beta hydrolase [Staphylococcus aureus]HCX3692543.1 alpha/beta hydrolase [Staphylococcus aureus]HDH4187209.1 alpha/beta hydrolase [Staphylococcus aureus]
MKNNYTFSLNSNVTRQKVKFQNRYGIDLVGDLYIPKSESQKISALVVSGPFGAVKEQSSGLYANELASRGFITLAFDNSFTGESGGEVRNVASPEIFTEDFSAAVDYLTNLDFVDNEKIGAMAICGLSGMAITAATVDSRIKAVATASMYDMSNSIGKGYKNSYTFDQRLEIIDYLSKQRSKDITNDKYDIAPHELNFDDNGNLMTPPQILPDELPDNPDPVLETFFNYYKTERGYHERSINSNSAWTATTPYSFFAFDMYSHIELLNDRKVLLIVGDNAHSKYHSEEVANLIPNQTELVIIPDADHCDLYDKKEKIPFDKIDSFFKEL